MRKDGGELPLGLDSDSQGLVGNAPSVVVPDAGGQELIKDVSQVSMAATKADPNSEALRPSLPSSREVSVIHRSPMRLCE